MTDEAATPTKTYLCSYGYKGQRWAVEIKAGSFPEAEAILRSISFNGSVDGELKASVPVPSMLERIWTWLTT